MPATIAPLSSLPDRRRFAAASIVMQICLGVFYAWAVFRGPLAAAYGWDKTVTIAPYRWSILFLTLGMIVAGFWQDRKGPRLVGSAGGLITSIGCLLAALIGNTPDGLIFSYGILAGFGVGVAYVTPIATCVKWFPDKRGLVVGLSVMGFGLGSLIFAPLLEHMMGFDAALYRETIPRTFMFLAALFFVVVIGSAQLYQVPPVGWKPEGWNPPAAAFNKRRTDYSPGEMLRTWQFYALWVVYFLGSSVGLTAIGESAPLIRELAAASAVLTGGAALGVMSLFNGLGRLSWGALSDKVGGVRSILGMCALSLATCWIVLPNSADFWRALIGLCLVGFCYGGYLALMPSITADYYGARNIGANYGILFSAWGAAGFVVPGYFAGIIEHAKQAGTVAAGYNSMFYQLGVLAIAGAVVALAAHKPK